MVQDLIEAISIKLNGVFGEAKKVYTEPIAEDLQNACFLIGVLSPTQKQLLSNRYFREHPFKIQYFPLQQGNNAELQSTASELLEALEYITLANGDLVRGSKMHYESVDGVLYFFVHYNLFIAKPVETDAMETVQVNGELKG